MTYDVWGKPSGFDAAGASITPSSFASRLLFTGREYDVETGLYHYRARAYSPTLGRFIQTDPIDFGGGDGNLFRYVSNNPVNWVDPLGHCSSDWFKWFRDFMRALQQRLKDRGVGPVGPGAGAATAAGRVTGGLLQAADVGAELTGAASSISDRQETINSINDGFGNPNHDYQ